MIHRFKQRDYNFVVDVNSGGVHVVDDLTYDVIGCLEPPLTEQLPDGIKNEFKDIAEDELLSVYSDIYEAYKAKTLFSPDEYEKYAKFAVSSPIKSMCLHIAHDCNLRCQYCFASTGNFGGGRKMMSFETGKRAIDFLLEKSADRQNLELDFFGGEPMMNFDVVKQIVTYARSKEKEYNKSFHFTITTNGMLLSPDKIDYINEEMSNVVLSVDGRREVNDKIRCRVDGSGCYDTIMPKFKELVEKRGDKEYYVRGTFTKYNLDFSNDVFHLLESGFDQVSVEPVVEAEDKPYAIRTEDLPRIFEEYDILADKIINLKKNGGFINFFHFMLDLDAGPCAIKRLRGCGSGNEYVAITPDGDIYPCHQFVGNEKFKMGSLYDGSFDEEMKSEFAAAHVYSKEKCRDCWAKFYCSGGCNANNYQFNGDILKPFELGCEMQKKRFECAIMMNALNKIGGTDEI